MSLAFALGRYVLAIKRLLRLAVTAFTFHYIVFCYGNCKNLLRTGMGVIACNEGFIMSRVVITGFWPYML